jgi:lipoprotein-anchoring transpeptidase ErfK/SrfK
MTFAFLCGRSIQPSRMFHSSAILVKQSGLAVALLVGSAAVSNARETVTVDRALEAGTVVIRTSEKRLYFVLGNGTAIRYRVAVGRPGKQWFGRLVVDGKHRAPAWTPYVAGKKPSSASARVIPGGSPANPMGAAALTLSGDKYAIHGTNRPASIGTYASAGCIRMMNEDVLDLFARVSLGTPVLSQP